MLGLYDASGTLVNTSKWVDSFPTHIPPGWTILPGRFVPDDAKIAEKEAG